MHSHSHSHSHDASHHNQAHFDAKADTYDATPGAIELTTQIAHGILHSSYPFDPSHTHLMDFACGTGLVSKHLAPHVASVVGVDISQGMLDHFNRRGIPNMRGIRAHLGVDTDVELGPFDVIVCSMAYHHMADIHETTQMLAELLKPTGVLFIADLITSHRPLDASTETVPHQHGFSRETIESVLAQAGLRMTSFQTGITTPSGLFRGAELNVFIAQGTK